MTDTYSNNLIQLSSFLLRSTKPSFQYTAELADLAIENGIACLINDQLERIEITNEFSQKISTFTTNAKIKESFGEFEIEKLLKTLSKENIDFVVLKGWALANTLYSSKVHRQRSDVDLMVKTDDIDRIRSIFNNLGFFNPRGWEPSAISKQISFRKNIARGVTIDFDIHLMLTNNPKTAELITFEEATAIPKVLEVDSTKINCINYELALIHASLHLLQHHADGDNVKLIWLYDLHLLIKKISNKSFIKLIQKKKLNKVIIEALHKTKMYFPSDNLNLLQSEIDPQKGYELDDLLLAKTNKATMLVRRLKSLTTIREKFNFLLETLIPPKAEIYSKYGKEAKVPLIFLYIYRAIKGLLKFLRG